MLVEAYNNSSQTGIEGFAKYAEKKYRLHHERWKVRNDTKEDCITKLLVYDDDGLPTLTYEDEMLLNKEVAQINKYHKRL
tara:strand:+ start:769 stop:1008 length:240 start_codon:yes stop_codon:yes gene_type:complete